jgi:hypothetical protein
MLGIRLLFNATRSHAYHIGRHVVHRKKVPQIFPVSLSFNSKRFAHSEKDDILLTLNQMLELSPLDVEKELHRSRRKLARLFKVANYPAFLECAQDMEVKVTTIMGKKNVSSLLLHSAYI